MGNSIYQCCYTNVSEEVGGVLRSGWQTVAVSTAIPQDAYKKCMNLQNANSTIQKIMTDEDGNVLNLFEISSDANYIYVSRTLYGLQDRVGRANMFSNAYIIPWKDENGIVSANAFLTISDENFLYDANEINQDDINIKRTAELNLETAMQMCKIDMDKYQVLISSVYAQMTAKTNKEPLHIQYDGSVENMKALLFCIYSGLPYYLRKSLNVASTLVSSPKEKNLIFTKNAKDKELYIIPETAENNILTPRLTKAIERNGFITGCMDLKNINDISVYFEKLEKVASALGDSTASNELILKIAFKLMQGKNIADQNEVDNAELESRISDALRCSAYESELLEHHVSDMVNQVCDRKIKLTPENEDNLYKVLGKAKTDVLNKAGEKYTLYSFTLVSIDEAVVKLNKLSKSEFEKYSRLFVDKKEQRKILDKYYIEVRLNENTSTWETLTEVWDETEYIPQRETIKERISYVAWELYCKELVSMKNGALSCDKYMSMMEKLLDIKDIEGCRLSAKEEYWDNMTFDKVDFDKLDEYQSMRVQNQRCDVFMYYCALSKIIPHYSEDKFFKEINQFFSHELENFVGKADKLKVFEKLIERVMTQNSIKDTMFKQTAYICAVMPRKEYLDDIFAIKALIKDREAQTLCEVYLSLANKMPLDKEKYKKILAQLNEVMIQELTLWDKEDTVGLDLWILVGSYMYDNAFEVFDDNPECGILSEDADVVVNTSDYITEDKFINMAREYVENKGDNAKFIKRCLNVVKQNRKRENPEENRGFMGNIGDQVGCIFSNLGKKDNKHQDKSQEEEEPEEQSYQEYAQPEDYEIKPERKSPDSKNSIADKFKGLFGKK